MADFAFQNGCLQPPSSCSMGYLALWEKINTIFFSGHYSFFFLNKKKTDVAENNKALFETRIIMTFIF